MPPKPKRYRRAVIIVIDGVGVGELPDAASFGDEGSDSLGNVVRARGRLNVPHLSALGLNRIVELPGLESVPVAGAYGKLTMRAAGKDSTSGHWELAGVVVPRRFPLFPHGFPKEAVAALRSAVGRELIGNRAASGTAIIAELGAAHLASGALILYTSADSVCQLAAHVDLISPEGLFRLGERARGVMTWPYAVARVIVRPFTGKPGGFRRLDDARRDFSLPPPAATLLDELKASGYEVVGIGKVDDLFAHRGFTYSERTRDNDEGVEKIKTALRRNFDGLLLANLNDTDTAFGHRNDVEGYARALERIDAALPGLMDAMDSRDLLFLLSDHGNDPTTPSTDHSREYTPLLIWHRSFTDAVPLGTRASLADVGQTVAANFGVGPLAAGASFIDEIPF